MKILVEAGVKIGIKKELLAELNRIAESKNAAPLISSQQYVVFTVIVVLEIGSVAKPFSFNT